MLVSLVGGPASLRRLMRRRRSTQAAYAAAFLQSPDGMLLVDGGSLEIIDANPALQCSLGYSMAELRRTPLERIFSDEDGRRPEALLAQLRLDPERFVIETRQQCRGGSFRPVEIRGYRVAVGSRTLQALTMRDISLRRRLEAELREKQQRLYHLAHHDQLTGLPNRLYLAAHLPGAIAQAKRRHDLLAVLFLDLDRFKHVNDSSGHEAGDEMLKVVAQRIRASTRTEDLVVRMGGDEFIVVLRSVASEGQIDEDASRITQALGVPIPVHGRALVTTVSIGVSLFPRDGSTMSKLLRCSDVAMYKMKERGGNHFQRFSAAQEHPWRAPTLGRTAS
jgi:diguanylate cyclase (GGDEF)-like protein/PAS domain S-box-containing protein